LFDAVLKDLAARHQVSGTDRLALPSHTPTMSEADVRGREAVERFIRGAGLMPPDATSLQANAHLSPTAFDRVVHLLVREHRLVRLGTLLFHADALASLRTQISDMKPRGASGGATHVDVATFKERFGLSRKFAIPLLEWLDKERVTRRVGDKRIVL
jgi:selenocysteine-specific elongation factor